MASSLSPDRVARYHEQGFLFPVPVFTADQAVALRRRLEALEAAHGRLDYAMKPYLTVTLADEMAHHPAVLDAVEAVLGPDILLWDGAFIIKEPGGRHFVSWHQDLTYWGLAPADGVVSVWIALSPVTPEQGCVRMISGSHRRGALPHVDRMGEDNLLSRGQTIEGVDEAAAVDVVLSPGEMSLHHGLVVHGSRPNLSGARRIGVNFQHLAPSVRQTVIEGDSAMLVRGRDGCRHFAAEPRPAVDFAPEAMAVANEIAERRHALLFRGLDAAALAARYPALA